MSKFKVLKVLMVAMVGLATLGCGSSKNEFTIPDTLTILGIDVQPASASVTIGETRQFSVEITLSDGSTVNLNEFNGNISWSSSSDAIASVDANGLARGVAAGTATITATVTAPGQTFTDTGSLTVSTPPNPDPVVNLDNDRLLYERATDAVALSSGATVTDTQANFNGGTLTVTVTGDDTGVNLAAPLTPAIGSITGDDSPTLTVSLDANATPTAVQDFLRAVEFSTDGTAVFGPNSVSVTLTDGLGGTGTDTRSIAIQGLNAQYFIVEIGDNTLQSAIDIVAGAADAQGSIIEVRAGSYLNDGTADNGVIVFAPAASLEGLQLLGPNAGVSAGINPGTRAAEAIVNAFETSSRVIIDGFQINGGPTSLNATSEQGIGLRTGSSGTVIKNNRIVDTAIFGAGDNRGILLEAGAGLDNLVIEFNRIENFFGAAFLQGVPGNPTSGNTINGNVAVNNSYGFSNDYVEETTYSNNVVRATAVDEEAFGFGDIGTGIILTGNDLTDQVVNAYFAGTTVQAENNFWGQASGPITTGANNQINRAVVGGGTIDFDPFLTEDPFPTLP